MEFEKLCPFLTKTVVLHNKASDSRVIQIGINAMRDNELIYSDFMPCIAEECMMFDENTRTCKYCK